MIEVKLNVNRYITLLVWIATLIFVGYGLGLLTKNEISSWYLGLERSTLTPPDYVFPIAWSMLYLMIAIAGWIIWRSPFFSKIKGIKTLYLTQLLLNWSWTPVFFSMHLTGISLLILVVMDSCIAMILFLSYRNLSSVTWLMLPYFLWILFATYLNGYIFYFTDLSSCVPF